MPRDRAPTDREIEVLRLVADRLTIAEIAARLWITERTVKHHISSLGPCAG